MKIIVVDDLRYFPSLEDRDVTYIRDLDTAIKWWESYVDAPFPVEMWLDHDLGPDTVRPLVNIMECDLHDEYLYGYIFNLRVRIISDNPVGREWIRNSLERWVDIIDEPPPRWRIMDGAIV